ncbi:uncharacterized protein F5147DRAFT_658152 [Suillus discolor]|uniref:Uncharacterized protein n=1 Tax=Suillus discolor TaxID=1912936 RepID=A0A9P7JMS2_9AGAM|nr:uncharacterized protein F5147DRAFT_658152 [Suillus discolor]KAG2090484.1 hypothetical protein F5147DRAFT_658152 [Suillus discolor]
MSVSIDDPQTYNKKSSIPQTSLNQKCLNHFKHSIKLSKEKYPDTPTAEIAIIMNPESSNQKKMQSNITETTSSPTDAFEALDDVTFFSPPGSLTYSEELDHLTTALPGFPLLSEDDLQIQVPTSFFSPITEEEGQSPSILSLSLPSQEESAQPPIISKTSKGTLIFITSLNNQFVYDSVTYVPNELKLEFKGKSKQQPKFIQSIQKNAEISTSGSDQNHQSQKLYKEKFLKFFSCLGHEWTGSDELQDKIKQQISKAMMSKDVQSLAEADQDPHTHYSPDKLPKDTKVGF